MSESLPGEETDVSTESSHNNPSVCPTCNQEFKSRLGVKQHHSKVHDESLWGVEYDCENCNKTFRDRPDKQQSNINVFCSIECKGEWQSENNRGENHPRYKPEIHLTRECVYCGDELEVTTNEIKSGRDGAGRYCSKDCMDKWRSENWVGENNPLYKGGDTYYGENWHRQRRKARERDNYTCQVCGVHESECDREHSVHHVFPVREFDDPEDANDLVNLVTMCEPCHAKWEGLYLRPDTRGKQ